jgi:hypothetical protein
MPYKDRETQKKAQREAMSRKRKGSQQGSQQGSHNNNSASLEIVRIVGGEGNTIIVDTAGTTTKTMTPASYVPGTQGRVYEVLPERLLWLTLSDNQVLDRANQPQCAIMLSGIQIQAVLKANDAAYRFVPLNVNKGARLRAQGLASGA